MTAKSVVVTSDEDQVLNPDRLLEEASTMVGLGDQAILKSLHHDFRSAAMIRDHMTSWAYGMY